MHRKMEREPQVNPEAYAAVDMHNINLIYMQRSLMEELIDDAAFLEKIYGVFVRIKISGVGQKKDMYRLVKVVGAHKVPEKYSIGKKTTNFALEILNLDKKELITMDTISNQDFTEEECNRLRQSMKCGLISQLKVGAVQEKAKVLQSVRVNDWMENERQRLEHLRDRASETGRKKELRVCVEKLQLLNDSEERTRRISQGIEVHVDPRMDPNYDSGEEMNGKKSAEINIKQTRADTSASRRKSKFPNSTRNSLQKIADANNHPKKMSTESTMQGLRTGKTSENFHHTNGTDVPTPSPMCEAGSVSSSVLTMSCETEPEKVWHYKDPSGNVQGPFTLLQLSKWINYFPHDLRVWLTFESEERSLLLTEVLSKQHTIFNQTTLVTTSTKATPAVMEGNKNSPSVDQINALSPAGCSMLNSSKVTVQPNKYSVPKRENVNSPEDCLSLSTSSIQPKVVHTLNSEVQCQTRHSVFIQSPGSPYGLTDLQHDGTHGGCSGESNHHHNSAVLRSSIMVQKNYNGKGNAASHHHNQHTLLSQNRNDSKNSSQGISVKDLSKNLPTRVGKDAPSPVFAWSPSDSRTASNQHDGSCLSSTINPCFFDEHHSSMASQKPKSCAPATPVEDRGSSSPSGMLSHSERVPIGTPQSAPSASASDMCKIEENMSQQRTVEADISNVSVNQSPESKIFSVSSPDNQDVDHEFPSPTPRPDNKEPVVDDSGLTPSSPEKLGNTYSPVSDPCKMEEIVNQHKIHESDAPNSSANHYPQCEIFHLSSSDNKDLEQESKCPIARPDNNEPAADSSLLASPAIESLRTASVSDIEVTVNQQKTLEEDTSDASLNLSPHSNAFPTSSTDNQDIDSSNLSPTVGNKELSMDNSGIKSAVPENLSTATASAYNACKTEILDKKITVETDASDGSITLPSKVSLVSSSDNLDPEHEFSCPAKSENMEPLVDRSVLTSATPENATTSSASASDRCKMEMLDKKAAFETDASNGSVTPSSRTEDFLVTYDNQDGHREYPSPALRTENKDPVMDTSRSQLAAPENLATKAPDDSPDAFALPKSGPPTGKLHAMESDFKGVEEIIQNGLYDESTVVTRENLLIGPSCGAESIDVSDVLESLIKQRCGTSYVQGTAELEDLLASAAEEEPQCSSPIALSPWGEQGDTVDSALWGIQDDIVNDMWPLLSPTPAFQPSSAGHVTEASETVAVAHGISDFFQRGPLLGEENVIQANSGSAMDWVLLEQVKTKPDDVSASSVAESAGIVGWQLSASQGLSTDTASGTSQNLYVAGCDKAVTSSKSSCEASRKQESTDPSVSREAIGNTNKSWNLPPVNVNRDNQKNHRRRRYSEISESWLLSSNNSRSRSDRFGRGGSSRRL